MARRRRHHRLRASDAADSMASSRHRSLVQLLVSILMLVMLILFWTHLSEGAAGCFQAVTEPPPGAPGQEAVRPEAPGAEPAQSEPPSVRFQPPDP